MRSITFVQAFQYWLKLTALAVPVVFLLLAWQADGAPGLSAQDAAAWQTAAGRRQGVQPLLDVLADPGDVPGHHGAAARAGPLLHQPRRPGRPPHHAGGAGAARRASTCCPRCTARWAGSTRPTWYGHRRGGADAARTAGRRDARRAADGAGHGGGVRRVPVDLVGADRVRRRGDRPGPARAGCARSGSPTLLAVARAAGAGPVARGRCRWRTWWGWRSRWRPRRSARCWCSASGGAGSPPRARWPGCSPAAAWPARAVLATITGGPHDGLAGALLAQPAAWTVPIAFAVMVVVSLLTPDRVPVGRGPDHGPPAHPGEPRPQPRRLAAPLVLTSGQGGAGRRHRASCSARRR